MIDSGNSIFRSFRSPQSLFQSEEDLGLPSTIAAIGRTMGPHRDQADTMKARRQLIEAGREFDAYFISYLMKVMRETVPQGLIENKQGAYFYSFYDQEIGRRAAESGGIGIVHMVEAFAKDNKDNMVLSSLT